MKILIAIAAVLSISSFLIFQYVLVTKGIKLSELYFIAQSLSIAAFAITHLKKIGSIFINSLIVLCSAFFIATVGIYVHRWVLLGDGSTNYYTAICISGVLTFIYLICYVCIEYIRKHKRN